MWTLVNLPAAEPLNLDEAKDHVRFAGTDQDVLIQSLIIAAREYVEAVTRRRLLTQTWDWRLAGFPRFPVEVPYPPLQSVTSITYRLDDAAVVWASANYRVLTAAGPRASRGQIVLADDVVVPIPDDAPDAVTIRVVQGYGDAGAAVPEALRSAMKICVGELWVQRQMTVVGTITAPTQFTIDQLLAPYRDLRW